MPLVADEKALLRVFRDRFEDRRRSHPEGSGHLPQPECGWTRRLTIPAGTEIIPLKIDESELAKSANVEVPASWIRPDVEVSVRIDPDNTLPDSLNVLKQFPQYPARPKEVPALI